MLAAKPTPRRAHIGAYKRARAASALLIDQHKVEAVFVNVAEDLTAVPHVLHEVGEQHLAVVRIHARGYTVLRSPFGPHASCRYERRVDTSG